MRRPAQSCTQQLSLPMAAPAVAIKGIAWRSVPTVCRSHQQMLIDGEPNGLWIRAVTHPTALRPYYVVKPNGEMIERKFGLLADAKAAAIEALNEIPA